MLRPFLLLQNIGLIGTDGSMTVLGDALKNCPEQYQEPCLFALELMKFGLLTGEPFEPMDRSFPVAVDYPSRVGDNQQSEEGRMLFLLTRVMSLMPMRLRSDMWNSDVDFDLAAFHCQVRLLKRSLRQLTESCLAYLLLEDLSRMQLVPQHAMNPVTANDKYRGRNAPEPDSVVPPVFPTFTLPRACSGIVMKSVLKEMPSKDELGQFLRRHFPACSFPREDLISALNFWEEVFRCVEVIAEPLQAEHLLTDMRAADKFLQQKRKLLGL